MKIKQFVLDGSGINVSDKTINEFIQDKEIVDIKLATCHFERVVLVMYEDKGGSKR